jgi:hypothetical protein
MRKILWKQHFKEAIKVEKDMLSLKGNLGVESSKEKGNTKTKTTTNKPFEDKKDHDSTDMEALQRIVKKLSNEIIDLKNNCGEGSSNPNNFFKFQPKKEKSTPPTNKTTPPSLEGINMEDFFQSFQAWESVKKTKSKDEGEGEDEQHDQSHEPEEKKEQQVNYFWDISFGLGE